MNSEYLKSEMMFLVLLIVSVNLIDLNSGQTREETEKWEEYKVVN